MQVLLVAATPFEIAPTWAHLEQHFLAKGNGVFVKDGLDIQVLVTGVGMVATSWHLGLYLAANKPDLVLHAGVAGAFDRDFKLGDVVHVTTERFGDLGVEEADGRFTDLFEMKLMEPDQFPFSEGVLKNVEAKGAGFLPAVQGLTVNKVHGSSAPIAAIRHKYPEAQVESMEGAAFFHACLLAEVSFLEIRSISNYVEARNREAWDLPLAINNLNQVLVGMLRSFEAK